MCAQRLGLASVARNLATRDARRFVDGDRAAETRIFNSRRHFPGPRIRPVIVTIPESRERTWRAANTVDVALLSYGLGITVVDP